MDSIGLRVPPMEIRLKPGVTLRPQPCRYLSPKIMDKVKQEIDMLLSLGILERCENPEITSPLVICPKPDGNIRMAVDYRLLNELLMFDAASIPFQKQLFQFLSGKCYFTKVDNERGFYQLNLASPGNKLTSIVTPWGTYYFTRCPFGISTAPGVYQDRMQNIILEPYFLKSCVVYIEDTIIAGNSCDDFLINLDNVFTRMAEYNVRLKPTKCNFGYDTVEFLGYKFDGNGYSLTDTGKQGILKMTPPSSLTQLRSFLGMINFFRDFTPRLSLIMSPLSDLTKTSTHPEFIWTYEAQLAFEEVKNAISNSKSLYHFDDTALTALFVDACNLGIVLMQFINNIWVPIAFLSHKFSDAAKKWATIVQECYSIIFSVLRWSSYLLGRHFYIYTDHKNLVYLSTSTIPKLVRWRLRLMEFSFTIIHIPGKDNVIADSLSRLFGPFTIDPPINPNELLPSIHNSIVGHHGISHTITLLKSAGITWPTYKDDITNYIKNCPVCQKVKYSNTNVESPLFFLHGSHPMQSLSIDTIGPLPLSNLGYQFILVIIDNFSKFVNLYPTPSTEAISYVQSLIHHIGLFGLMKTVRTDRGTQFTAHVCSELSDLLQFEHLKVVPYHPEGNGIVERVNAAVMKHLRAIVLDLRVKDSWQIYLPLIQRIINTSYNRSIGTTPSKIIFGDMLALFSLYH